MCLQPICMQGSSEIRHRERSCSWPAALGLWEDCGPEVPQDRGLGPRLHIPSLLPAKWDFWVSLFCPYRLGFTIVPCETESNTLFPLCASLLDTYHCVVLQVRGEQNCDGGLRSLGGCSLVWETEALVKTQRNKMTTPTILGKRRNWRGWESNRGASPSRREVRTGSWEAVVAEC